MFSQSMLALALSISLLGLEADLVLQSGVLHDGGAGEPRVADLAVKDGRIVAIGDVEAPEGARVIDASGLIVAPGFIDLHNHSDGPITKEATRANLNYVTQGVTTIVTGNCGGGRDDVGAYLDQVDQHGAGTNVAHLIPHGALRRSAMGSESRPPSPAELEEMKRRIAQAMQNGAFGISTGLIYTPSSFADTDELVALAKVAGKHGGIYVSHMRDESSRLLEAVEEALEIGRRARLPVHISHFKANGPGGKGLAVEAVALVNQARKSGQRVTADQYPYIASSTSLAAMTIPARYRVKGDIAELLGDEEEGPKLRTAIETRLRERGGGRRLFVASYRADRKWQGKSLTEIAQQEDKTVFDLVVEIQSNGGARMVNFGMREGEVRLIMREPFVATASDGRAKVVDETVPHPRNYGTFPRKIARYALQSGVVSLPQAIRSATGLPADILGLPDRGYLKEGHRADLVVFDPQTLRDTATFEQPHQYAEGVTWVFVGGVATVAEGKPTGSLPGRALRRNSSLTAYSSQLRSAGKSP